LVAGASSLASRRVHRHGSARALGPFGGRAAMADPRPLGNGAYVRSRNPGCLLSHARHGLEGEAGVYKPCPK